MQMGMLMHTNHTKRINWSWTFHYFVGSKQGMHYANDVNTTLKKFRWRDCSTWEVSQAM